MCSEHKHTCHAGKLGTDILAGLDTDETFLPANGTYNFVEFANKADEHHAENSTAYNKAIHRVYVVGHVWGYSGDRAGSTSTTVAASVTCLQAKGTVGQDGSGTEVGGGSGDGAGSGSGSGSGTGTGTKNGSGNSVFLGLGVLSLMTSSLLTAILVTVLP